MTEETHQLPRHREEGNRAGHSAGIRDHSDNYLGRETKDRVLVTGINSLKEVSCVSQRGGGTFLKSSILEYE